MPEITIQYQDEPTSNNPLGVFTVSQDKPLPVQSVPGSASAFATRIDDASSTISYIGKAVAGADPSEAVWQIFRMDTGTSPLTIIKWADGNGSFDNIWDNRASLTYE